MLPFSIDAEESVLGGILFLGRALSQVADLIEPADFYDKRHETIFAAMVDLGSARGRSISSRSPKRCDVRGTIAALSASGSEAYLAELANKIASVDNITQHARIVRSKSTAAD